MIFALIQIINFFRDEEINPAEYATLSPSTDTYEPTAEQILYDPFTKAEDDFIRISYQGCLAQGILYSDHMMFVANELHRPYAAVCDRLLELNTLHRKNRPQMVCSTILHRSTTIHVLILILLLI